MKLANKDQRETLNGFKRDDSFRKNNHELQIFIKLHVNNNGNKSLTGEIDSKEVNVQNIIEKRSFDLSRKETRDAYKQLN